MKNDTQIKVTCLTNENNKDEFHFDYYNKEGSILGTVVVDERGIVGWYIWEKEYQENILYNVSYIFGKQVDDTIEYVLEGKQSDPIRWEKAQEFIESKGLLVNYKQNISFNQEFKNGIPKRNRARR